MPGSACRRSSVSPPTERRSTTSSTVKPRTFFPPATSRRIVVAGPASAAGSGWRSARHPSTTVTRVPRTLTRPATTGGAPGIRVGATPGTISRTRSASAAHTRAPTRKTSSRRTPASLIRSEEAKILQGVALSKQIRVAASFGQRRSEFAGPLGAQHQPGARHRMDQAEQCRVQQLARGERLDALGRAARRRRDAATAAEGILAVPDDRVPDGREVHADLVGASRAELDAHEVGVGEARDHADAGDGVAPAREDRHALAVLRVARDRALDLHAAVGDIAPPDRRLHAPPLAPLTHPPHPPAPATRL